MTWLPFICLGAGFFLGFRPVSKGTTILIDRIINVALVALMLTIGMNIGINDSVMLNLGAIGFNCMLISLSAIFFSVLLVLLVEKLILPLDALRVKLDAEKLKVPDEIGVEEAGEEKKTSPLIWVMPVSILFGVAVGYFILSKNQSDFLGYSLIISLILLYTGVGISLGSNRKVFSYIKVVGYKVVYISIAIFLGSLSGGLLSGLLLDIPLHISITSASGMSYYSITGAYMTQVWGIEAGTYGFVVNVMREFFTVLLLPLLVKISKGSPIASGAAGNMDTMLVPVTKFVGPELGLVALITGVILTFAVPVILPVLYSIF